MCFSVLIPLPTLLGMGSMEMSLLRVKSIGGWVQRDMIMPEQRCFCNIGMPEMLRYCFHSKELMLIDNSCFQFSDSFSASLLVSIKSFNVNINPSDMLVVLELIDEFASIFQQVCLPLEKCFI